MFCGPVDFEKLWNTMGSFGSKKGYWFGMVKRGYKMP